MATLINKEKQISKQRQEFVEHNFEAMVGARKRRYNETQAQKQRTEFFEDYYLLYTRNKYQLDQQKSMWNELKEWLEENKYKQLDDRYIEELVDVVNVKLLLKRMQELEGEDESL